MSKKNLITVAIPTFKRRPQLIRLLRNLTEQRFKNFEVIISDNDCFAEADDLIEFNDKLTIRYVKNNENLGLLKNTIELVNLAQGELMCWISDDDLRSDRFLECLYQLYIEHGDDYFYCCDFKEIDVNKFYVKSHCMSHLRKYKKLSSKSSLIRQLSYYFHDQRFGKCNLFFGLFKTEDLKALDLKKISLNYTNFSFDNFLVYAMLERKKCFFLPESHVFLTVNNHKHYKIKRARFNFVMEYCTDLKNYLSNARFSISMLIMLLFPLKFLKDMFFRVCSKCVEKVFKNKADQALNKISSSKEKALTDKKKLPDVTLVMVATKGVSPSVVAFQYSQLGIEFGDTLFFSHYKPPMIESHQYRFVEAFDSVESWGQFILYDLYKYINTSHILLIHSDGFVINPDAWDDSYLNFDYIGSPFPKPKDDFSYRTPSGKLVKVGNSVSIRSKSLLEASSRLQLPWVPFYGFKHEDGFLTCQYRDLLEAEGYLFASYEIALCFGREYEYEDANIDPFIFHKWCGPNKRYPCFEKV